MMIMLLSLIATIFQLIVKGAGAQDTHLVKKVISEHYVNSVIYITSGDQDHIH